MQDQAPCWISSALHLVASDDGAQHSLNANADARVDSGLFAGDERAQLALDPARKAYVHLVRGGIEVNGRRAAQMK